MPSQPLTALLFASIVTVEARGKEVRVLLKRMIFVLVVVALVMTMPMSRLRVLPLSKPP
jgi:hypothetical protein